MSRRLSRCHTIEPDLVATVAGEAAEVVARDVDQHLGTCPSCQQRYDVYTDIERMVGVLKRIPERDDHLILLRDDLATRLAELRRRSIRYRIFASPVGPILIGASDEGVVLLDYLTRAARGRAASHLHRLRGVEAIEDGGELEPFYRQILEYLDGRRQRLGWPLDLRLIASSFHRDVLQETAELPYGAVTSYARIARQVGHPSAVRAVAQALRANPVPIAVPCHRVVGSGGDLVGYAGRNVALKARLLALEGVPLVEERGEPRVRRAAMYVRAGRADTYCLPSCGALASSSLARLTLYASQAGAEAGGLRPCRACRPDLHPLAA